MLVTARLRPGLPNLRHATTVDVAWSSFREYSVDGGFRVVHASIQGNHWHAIVEADSTRDLSRGMQGLLVRLSRRWNLVWERRGSVFDGAYHARSLRTPREVRNALVYVLHNGRKHGVVGPSDLDPCSSARWFDGWVDVVANPIDVRSPFARPRTWLLLQGWKRAGLLGIRESPRASNLRTSDSSRTP